MLFSAFGFVVSSFTDGKGVPQDYNGFNINMNENLNDKYGFIDRRQYNMEFNADNFTQGNWTKPSIIGDPSIRKNLNMSVTKQRGNAIQNKDTSKTWYMHGHDYNGDSETYDPWQKNDLAASANGGEGLSNSIYNQGYPVGETPSNNNSSGSSSSGTSGTT